MPRCLNVEFVEQVHRGLQQGRSVSAFVSDLNSATLAGIAEYACLKRAMNGQLPTLPNELLQSDLARQLSAASPSLAIADPAPRRQMDTVEVRSIEFLSLRDEDHVASQEVELFEIRFNRSAESVGIASSISDQLQSAFHEMIENAVLHSECAIPPLAGYVVANGTAQFCVADVGIGVLASLTQCADYSHIKLHKDAIRAALHDGTSRFGQQKGGLGFREVFKAVVEQWGSLRFRSGEGCISMNGDHLSADLGTEYFPPAMAGFQVAVACRASAPTSPAPLL